MPQHYTATAKWFHWLIVLLVGIELLIGALMPGIYRHASPGFWVNLHFSFGLVIIALTLLRALWRLTHRAPPLPQGTATHEAAAAHLMHAALYTLLFIIPFAGWAWANSVGWPVVALWLIPLPAIAPTDWQYTWLAADAHVYLVGLLCVLIGLHILAALWHWYVKKDGILERMLSAGNLTDRAMAYLNRFRL